MSDPAAFHRAVIENYADDGPRLVYADWLDERGDQRGEFIRVQCEIARTPSHLKQGDEISESAFHSVSARDIGYYLKREWCGKRTLRHKAERIVPLARDGFPNPALLPLRAREAELLALSDQGHRWLGFEPVSFDGPAAQALRCGFGRGFCETVQCHYWVWADNASELLAHNPIREVWLSSRPSIVSSRASFWLYNDGPKDRVMEFVDERYLASACVVQALNKKWPGITFHVPREEMRPDQAIADYQYRRQLTPEEVERAARTASTYSTTGASTWTVATIQQAAELMRESMRHSHVRPTNPVNAAYGLPDHLYGIPVLPVQTVPLPRPSPAERRRLLYGDWTTPPYRDPLELLPPPETDE